MNSIYCKESFQVNGDAVVTMCDGRVITSSYPSAVWRWVQDKDWSSITVSESRMNNNIEHIISVMRWDNPDLAREVVAKIVESMGMRPDYAKALIVAAARNIQPE